MYRSSVVMWVALQYCSHGSGLNDVEEDPERTAEAIGMLREMIVSLLTDDEDSCGLPAAC